MLCFRRQIRSYIGTCRRYCSRNVRDGQYCLDLVRKQDYEGFLVSLLMPEESRSAAITLRAFNAELASVRDSVSNVHIGKLRLQFWKDGLENIYAGKPAHQPIALELFKAVNRHKLSKRWLSRMIEEREKTLEDKPFPSVADVESYAENTSSSLLYLTLQSLGIHDVHADHAASHIGKSQGIVNLLRGIPLLAQRRDVLIPMELTIRYNLSQEDVIRGNRSQDMKDLTYDLASLANSHLKHARKLKKDVIPGAFPAFLATAPIDSYLKRIQQADFDVFHPSLSKRYPLLPVKIWLQNYRRTF
ncbi:NADH dehydrogenase (ubiquinone) complex I, assembly factor 6-like [Lytechinus variegatus]|uniref:NADH dehydrogenase (ubiquinone) complex I, assembly factor 6-like n=1 Tax=Lytechinus variegatus TaxID=7654 RepID=UPI001BB20FB9|nr:NADH dehydrogenase (ubiquinone) complex I, assembly factor 6-like [Lytechinus variegatus]